MPYVLIGARWPDPVITWSFAAPSPAVGSLPAVTAAFDEMVEQVQVYAALEVWTAVSGVSFAQVAEAPDIRIGFFDTTQGGTMPESRTLGITIYTQDSSGGFMPGTLVVVQDPAFRAWDFGPAGEARYAGTSATAAQILTHEIGHALGLDHSDTSDDLMYFQVGSANRGFSEDDLAGIQALYGGPLPTEPEVPPGVPAGPGGVLWGSVVQFSAAGYLAAYPDVAATGLSAMWHFEAYGWREGRDPAAQFDVGYYLAQNPDVAAAGVNPFTHYLTHGRLEGRLAAAAVVRPDADGFDAGYYLLANPDVARSGMDARLHYLTFGWQEGRDPNGYFDTTAYLTRNPDVAAAGLDPLAHYIGQGAAEGRTAGPDFNTAAYLAANPDVAAAGINPLLHYMLFGLIEGRTAHADWDV